MVPCSVTVVKVVAGKKMLVQMYSIEILQLGYLDEFRYKKYSYLNAVMLHMRVEFVDAWGTGKVTLNGVGPKHFVGLSMYYSPIVVVRMLVMTMAHLTERVSVSMRKHLL